MEEAGLQPEVLETMYMESKREAGGGKKEEKGRNAKRRWQAKGRLEMVTACRTNETMQGKAEVEEEKMMKKIRGDRDLDIFLLCYLVISLLT